MILELTVAALFVGSGYVDPVWRWLLANLSETALYVGGMFVSLVGGYYIGALPYMVLDWLRIPFFARFKVQEHRYPTNGELARTARDLMVLFVGVMLPMIYVGAPVFKWLGMTAELPLPSAHAVVIQVLFFFVVEDFMNYWIHRWLHTPWAYKNIHSVHHEHDAPFALAATFAHPIEVIMLGIPTFTGPALVGPHMLTMWIWLMMRQYEAIDIHSGYEFPWNINSYLRFYAGTEHHDYHHHMYSGNFASVFTWCDVLYGTSLGYETFRAKKLTSKKL
uniref:Fatty acid hydroxylase domain-containing protein n=1 Tax=Erythrolobus australicus TaxID=1077150 RepID=A0A7S1XJL5_9RHOD|mmetsp:Transcript_5006/g.13495  ORF Transcript_5006/g.13495 Transcript_5006/m.13495 type:complete len:277 (+) Transcript_5006:41-871(+)